MANTSNILAVLVIAFLASLSLSLAKHDSLGTISDAETFEKPVELQPSFLREKRQKEAEEFLHGNLRDDDPLELEREFQPSELKPIFNERRAVPGSAEAKEIGQMDFEEREQLRPNSIETKTSNDIVEGEEEDDMFSYRSMHDLIQALLLADEEDIVERLQQLRESQNATKSSNLPKREAVAAAAAASASSTSSNLLGANLWDAVPLVDLDAHSCEVEAFSHGHLHLSGTIVHEFFCELRKLWHYVLIVLRNLKSELTLGPLVVGDVVAEGIFGQLFHHASHLVRACISEPHHLLILPDIIRDAVPFPSISGAIHRIVYVFRKVLHFGLELFHQHVRHVLAHLFSHRHSRVHLLQHLHHWREFGSILPVEEISTASASASAATATAAASSDCSLTVPDYHRSLAEVFSSFRGFHDGYLASGLPHLIRTGARSFSTSSAFPKFRSYLSQIPFFNFCGNGPIGQSGTATTTTTTTATATAVSSAAASSAPSVIEPTIVPLAPIAPIETETASSSASATATTVVETQPTAFSAGPTIVPSIIPYESNVQAAAAAAAAAATTAVSPAIASGCETAVPTLSPAIVTNTEVVENTVAAASAAASAATSAPFLSSRGYNGLRRPFVSTVAPASAPAAAVAAASSASASASATGRASHPRYRGLDLDVDRRTRYHPLIRSRGFPASASAATATAAAAASTSSSSAVASGSASSVFSSGLNFVLPREQVVGALGYNYLMPGDIVAIILRNKAILFGRVLDATSPITFSFLRPQLRASLLRHGGRVWKLLPRDFRDPECIRKFNNPLLLRYSLL
ncbi:uncharacterized protein LOC105203696 [Solenopsis invicta]|uniref:uncharacterized protein LOC105203696 n=1 Tax=Solenopsis invicta TaxID=13686 RepID=UPI00193E46C5|nr:uncharacterized protein LOC105203696 [Solenopsis invicta]